MIKSYHLLVENQSRFALIKLMVTIEILVFIAFIAVPAYRGYKKAQTREAWLQLTQLADNCILKAVKSLETNSDITSFSLEPLPSGAYFTYDPTPACTTSGGTFTATGHSGAVSGEALTVTVTMTGTNATKTWGGSLF
jgi:Tfp pilus assembly major pilin PilA